MSKQLVDCNNRLGFVWMSQKLCMKRSAVLVRRGALALKLFLKKRMTRRTFRLLGRRRSAEKLLGGAGRARRSNWVGREAVRAATTSGEANTFPLGRTPRPSLRA
jgi:hypothetical protein